MLTYRKIIDTMRNAAFSNYKLSYPVVKSGGYYGRFGLSYEDVEIYIRPESREVYCLTITLKDEMYGDMIVLNEVLSIELSDKIDSDVKWQFPRGTWADMIEKIIFGIEKEMKAEEKRIHDLKVQADAEKQRKLENALKFYDEKYTKLLMEMKKTPL
jgi:hypothetical protein